MADMKISELSSVASLNNGDLIEVSQVDSSSPTGYTSMKASMKDVGDKVVNEIQYTQELDTSAKKITGAINENNGNIGDLSALTTTDKSSLVGAVNEVNGASLKASELRVIHETKTTNNNGTIDSNSLTGGAIPLSRTILSAYSPSGYFVKISYYSTRYTFDIYDNSFQLVRNTAVEICVVSTADLTK